LHRRTAFGTFEESPDVKLTRGVQLVVAGVLLSSSLLCSATVVSYAGSLATGGGGLPGTGAWFANGPTTLDWTISRTDNDPWHYHHHLVVPVGNVSHIVLET
jgi:hypothetical protein